MFPKSKKQKNQKIETEKMNENFEKNENIEKNESTAVNSENISENSESTFPSAKDTLEASKSQWKQVTAEEIIQKIQKESSCGRRFAKFYNSCISDELVKELQNQGYKLDVVASPVFVGPYFEISW